MSSLAQRRAERSPLSLPPPPPPPTPWRRWLARAWVWFKRFGFWLFDENAREVFYVAFVALAGLIRRSGKTIDSGSTGLKFTLGRARELCEPGFHWLVPLAQTIKIVPTRSRALDLPQQRVTTLDGLVYSVDANLVYRVVDVRKALIEIDDLQKGMLQMLGLGVQEVLRGEDRASLRVSSELDRALAANLTHRLEPWGVAVERAGFATINPTEHTARITQLGGRVRERTRALARFTSGGVTPGADLALIGTTTRFVRRTRALRSLCLASRRRREWKRFESGVKQWLVSKSDEIPRTARDVLLRNAKERFERAHVV